MARCLIIGCGCRGLELAGALAGSGHAIRGTTRDPSRRKHLDAAGVEGVLGDPDRVATIAPAFDHVSVACVLLGSVRGTEAHVAALHGPRLEMLLTRMLDTTIRGVVYEARGGAAESVLASGAAIVRRTCDASLIPYVLLDEDPGDHARWLHGAVVAVEQLL